MSLNVHFSIKYYVLLYIEVTLKLEYTGCPVREAAKKVIFLVAQPLRKGVRGSEFKGLANKKKITYFEALKKSRKKMWPQVNF